MENNVFFIIDDKKLYLEQVLVDYMDIPIFFLCKSESVYYIALCTDIEESAYVVVNANSLDIYNMIHGKESMRHSILKQKEYWEIISDDDVSKDIVRRHPMTELDSSCLPEENACFQILTDEMSSFVRKFDNYFLKSENFVPKKEKLDLREEMGDSIYEIEHCSLENFISRIVLYTKGVAEKRSKSKYILYDLDTKIKKESNKGFVYRISLEESTLREEDNIAA
ncbi:MAG: hypothetical protein LUD16_07565 [Lachnospiraceae bacterium]|nr:hypothetical protein [Lachnospiraceae bacterium]